VNQQGLLLGMIGYERGFRSFTEERESVFVSFERAEKDEMI